jgi:small-conductance mechanosensitive channel
VKSKYSFTVFFSVLILTITGTFGYLAFHPSLKALFIASSESLFLVFTLGSISLSNGIRGADFTEVPRPRMIRFTSSLLNLILCFLAVIAVMSPLLPYALSLFIPGLGGPFIDPYLAVTVSAIIAATLTLVFYRLALNNARELLRKAEI